MNANTTASFDAAHNRDTLLRYARTLPALVISRRSVCDLEMLAVGAFSPLDRFMGQNDLRHVLETMRLADGQLFPVPITLPVHTTKNLHLDSDIVLCDEENRPLAVLTVDEIYRWDCDEMAQLVCDTRDPAHPLVAEMRHWGPFNVTGRLQIIQMPPHYDFQHLRHTPAQTRQLLAAFGRKNVVAFQTRNPLHRAHEELVKHAMAETDGALLLHPVVGMTQPGDIDHYTRVRTYQALIDNYLPRDRVLLSLLPFAMRMAGPREALLHAIIRRNYGATHMIIGRDHAGPGADSSGKPFYDPYAAQALALQHEAELGIRILPYPEMVYLPDENRYEQETSVLPQARVFRLYGTQVRRDYLARGRRLPEWFTRPEVSDILVEAYARQGVCVWLTGLSGAGKSTTAQALAARISEIGLRTTLLDGDVVRQHLSQGLGFSKADRDTHIRRLGFLANEIVRQGAIVICAAISPYQAARDEVRRLIGENFVEVYVDTPLAVCEQRDPKGLYAKARRGEITGFTGVDDPYEPPTAPELRISAETATPEENAQLIFNYLVDRGHLARLSCGRC
ncbi:MAG: bifunctional sulfate adenylyltransferase/adenylylsulfate kinase [Aggregatilineales bacterium]